MSKNPEVDNPPKNSHEKAQQPKGPGLVHPAPQGPALMGTSDSTAAPSESSAATKTLAVRRDGAQAESLHSRRLDAFLAELSPEERQLLEQRIVEQKEDPAGDVDLSGWWAAVEGEARAGREYDILARNGADPKILKEAEHRWRSSVEKVATEFDALPYQSNLDLCRKVARQLIPQPGQQAPAGLGRALAQIGLEVQREMVRKYRPQICAATRWHVEDTRRQWREAERKYRATQHDRDDVVTRTEALARAQHFRRLIPEVLYLHSRNEETRSIRWWVRYGTTEQAGAVLRMVYADEESEFERWRDEAEVLLLDLSLRFEKTDFWAARRREPLHPDPDYELWGFM